MLKNFCDWSIAKRYVKINKGNKAVILFTNAILVKGSITCTKDKIPILANIIITTTSHINNKVVNLTFFKNEHINIPISNIVPIYAECKAYIS